MIPYGRQNIQQDDIDAVVNVLKSDWLTQGPAIPLFEEAVATKVQAKYAVATNSATSALHIACLALGVGEGDWLWTSPNTFVASANCGLYCGAKVDFVDIDPLTYNLSANALVVKLEQAEKQNMLPKVVVLVHFAGQSCDMEPIHKLAKQYNFKIIEDASHAIGGIYKGDPIGCCKYSDVTVFSFHPVKVVTTAEGGVAVTNNPEIAEKMQLLRSHGITRNEGLMHGTSHGAWYYEQVDLGFNYRMTDIQAALGTSQLKRLDTFVKRRHKIACIYDNELGKLPLILPFQQNELYSAFHLYVVQVDEAYSPINRGELFKKLRSSGIGVNVHYIPVYKQPYYQRMNIDAKQFVESEKYYSRTISLPMYYDLSESDQLRVIDVLKHELVNDTLV
ncbi:MAG: UDP-4-amino-4,6-dideoxy-N-acetyl-beta-L-altrosamine transaminase [Gammaproteobacteria bacterium]|nr:UDP-4-amino-4,6-dideoxy-N-acetyl-beta-L-altrosamine transaminase [Gammaproteobacteria bacterium]